MSWDLQLLQSFLFISTVSFKIIARTMPGDIIIRYYFIKEEEDKNTLDVFQKIV